MMVNFLQQKASGFCKNPTDLPLLFLHPDYQLLSYLRVEGAFDRQNITGPRTVVKS